jgi:hypothetical protein
MVSTLWSVDVRAVIASRAQRYDSQPRLAAASRFSCEPPPASAKHAPVHRHSPAHGFPGPLEEGTFRLRGTSMPTRRAGLEPAKGTSNGFPAPACMANHPTALAPAGRHRGPRSHRRRPRPPQIVSGRAPFPLAGGTESQPDSWGKALTCPFFPWKRRCFRNVVDSDAPVSFYLRKIVPWSKNFPDHQIQEQRRSERPVQSSRLNQS